MEIEKHFYFIAIILILFVGVTPPGQELMGWDDQGTNNNILAGINSDTDGISNLLTQQNFNDENFAFKVHP
jgi:hypothetical protein